MVSDRFKMIVPPLLAGMEEGFFFSCFGINSGRVITLEGVTIKAA
jgi:hypothetical protein